MWCRRKLDTRKYISEFFFFQAEDGIRDYKVTGVQTCALPISPSNREQVRFVEIPATDYPPIQQACAVLRSSKQQQLATEFEAYIRTSEAAAIQIGRASCRERV